MSLQRGLIAARAYELWKLRGSPEGSPALDWHQAEKEILGRDDDPSEPNATLDALQQQAADVLTSGLDVRPPDMDTDNRSLSRPISKPVQPVEAVGGGVGRMGKPGLRIASS